MTSIANANKHKFPKTRYQGSKYKLSEWIQKNISHLDFKTALDAFSGTSSIAYMMKKMGKQVYTNDIMPCNYYIAKALIENNNIHLEQDDIEFILTKDQAFKYDNFIEQTFHDIYYIDEENKWLDITIQNILRLKNEYKQAIAFWALFQACIIKRPYNLFHRKNLHIRTSDVERSFGNKTTWDKPFDHFFLKFAAEANHAIFSNMKNNYAVCGDIIDFDVITPDLVYIDTPYIPSKGTLTTYEDFYHFLNGLSDYYNWNNKIEFSSKHLKLKTSYSIWEDKTNIILGFEELFKKFKKSKMVISYRKDGIPTIDTLVSILKMLKKTVSIEEIDYKYVLSNKKEAKEVLIIAE
jgi:adenine-specific DNA methylase